MTKAKTAAVSSITATATNTTVIGDSLFDIKIEMATAGLIPYYSRRLLKQVSEESALTVAKYILAMKTEINLSDHYRQDVIYLLSKLSIFCNKSNCNNYNIKSFKQITRQDILSFLDSYRKPESADPLHKWIGTYNIYRIHFVRFFKWLNWHFVVVTDTIKKAALAELFHRGWETYIKLPTSVTNIKFEDPERNATQKRIISSTEYLVEHLAQVPVHVILCIAARTEGQPIVVQSAVWGSIAPAAWSFMLAARSFGLGTSWTSLHLFYEEEAANILNIPYKEVMQAALIPVAYTIGTDFKPAPRNSVHTMVHWNTW